MSIVHKAGNIHKNSNGASRWALGNTPDNPGYVPLEAEPQNPIEEIKITDIVTELVEEVRESYKKDRNCYILTSLLDEDCKDTYLATSIDETWKMSYSECHDSIYSRHLSEYRTLVKVKNCARWPYWRKETIEYCHTCDRCQNKNRSKGKEFGLTIHIQEPKSAWEVAHMDWVTALPSSGDKIYNSCLVIVNRYSKTPYSYHVIRITLLWIKLFFYGVELFHIQDYLRIS
ncbi:hypothetical protein O181_056279 [Austropuccinia psidii MF-1]|uniref:Integrase zinc-binding domain-containing protein n=1 Tax=Austropuccinia psidii MF-1 TaxID=1389203 RepID=A0A9Q3HVH5_9BASI|nr:hypothetical protein [Austropuccinia psidii MF-1]